MSKTIEISLDLAERIARTIMKPRDETVQRRAINELRALLAAPVAATCANCKASTADICNQNGCGYLESGNGAPVVERQPIAWALDVEGYKTVIIDSCQRALSEQEHFHGRGRTAVIRDLYASPPAPVAVPDGWKLVPIEPTELMIRSGDQNYSWSVAKIYKAMIEDAPACLDKVKEMNQ